MANVKITLNSKGVREMLKSNEMKAICREYADKAVERLGEGYEADSYVGTNRANASMRTKSAAAVRENAKSNTILKAVYAGND